MSSLLSEPAVARAEDKGLYHQHTSRGMDLLPLIIWWLAALLVVTPAILVTTPELRSVGLAIYALLLGALVVVGVALRRWVGMLHG